MKILYIGWLNLGGTSRERCDALTTLGHDIIPFDMLRHLPGAGRIESMLMGRFEWGQRLTRTNRDLLEFVRGQTFDIVWVDKGTWLFPEVLAEIRAMATRKFAAHYTPDAQILDNRSRHYIKAIPVYDLHVTTKPFEIEPLKKHGAKQVELVLQGYGAKFGKAIPAMARAEFASEVCFVGHSQKSYRKLALAVAETGCDFKIWGPKWTRWARLSSKIRPLVHGDGLWGDDYPAALLSSKIALAFLSKYIPETTTTRTFEIPATGAFMLAERSEDHLALFDEDEEAAFFGSIEELKEKVRYYLRNDSERQRIAAAGRRRSMNCGYTLEHQLARALAAIEAF